MQEHAYMCVSQFGMLLLLGTACYNLICIVQGQVSILQHSEMHLLTEIYH